MSYFKRSLAVLLTCHNRREKTLQCLDTLFSQKSINNIEVTVYLVDDGSTDGTSEAVKEKYPEVNILKGNGSLYWTGGMRKAMNAAIEEGYDFYLWLNDDTVLYKEAISKLFETFNELNSQEQKPPIIVGSLCDPDTGEITYGGQERIKKLNPLKFGLISSLDKARQCDVFNGNVVLFPSEVITSVGNLNKRFRHTGGDFDYALRANKKGYKAWVVPAILGECPRNSNSGTWKDETLPVRKRVKKLLGPKGEPIKERFYFVSRYGGFLWPIIFLLVYIRFCWDILFSRN
ncbi:glycosyltransferase family 2 protein [Aliifodinibius salicampi]|uniref:Glycosyltransferase family 2 protein n=1 Tax=Fodinibius salicampi TaxID=1920655 RepID=A0ABT3PYX2_9BACT|nr:glycosyltransferase family 2 protein [Fodinibius salicampi]MCW9713070.1 glycosyltransferase family 2 protein [Fodinibius salicampi]